MNTFFMKVIASDRVFFEGRCKSVVIPAPDGEKGIWPNHENMVIALVTGNLRVQTEDSLWHDAVVGAGFAEIVNNRVILIVDTAERPEEIDVRRAQEARERASEQLRQQQSIQAHYQSQASLARAMMRLKYARKHWNI